MPSTLGGLLWNKALLLSSDQLYLMIVHPTKIWQHRFSHWYSKSRSVSGSFILLTTTFTPTRTFMKADGPNWICLRMKNVVKIEKVWMHRILEEWQLLYRICMRSCVLQNDNESIKITLLALSLRYGTPKIAVQNLQLLARGKEFTTMDVVRSSWFSCLLCVF
jgi:hypothetical protein